MVDLRKPYVSVNPFLFRDSHRETFKKYFYWFCAFFLLMALLEFSQDYISAMLNENPFRLVDSLSYKLFWPLFIPFSLMLIYLIAITEKSFPEPAKFVLYIFLIPVIALTHLLIFSLLLSGISHFTQTNPWPVDRLITEKLSTRLYLGLSVYILVTGIHFYLSRKKFHQPSGQPSNENSIKKISVKTGQTSTLVDTDDIKWISSDGPYLFIHTDDKKHVVLDSLKHIITTLPENFKRIHRSTIVNINKINELKSRGNGDYDVIMDNNRELRLSRNYTKPLKGSLF